MDTEPFVCESDSALSGFLKNVMQSGLGNLWLKASGVWKVICLWNIKVIKSSFAFHDMGNVDLGNREQ